MIHKNNTTFLSIFLLTAACILPAAPAFAKNFIVQNDSQTFMFVDGTSSNVGIGSSTPQAKLDVEVRRIFGVGMSVSAPLLRARSSM